MFLPLEAPAVPIDESQKQEFRDTIRKAVQCILLLAKDRSPFRKADLNRMAFAGSSISIRHYAKLVLMANIDLNRWMGMRLYELDDKLRYILVNSNGTLSSYHKFTSEDKVDLTVIYLVLTMIFISEDQALTFENLYKNLSSLKMNQDLLKTRLANMVKNLYLVEEKDQEERLYRWGQRAKAEMDPEPYFNSIKKLLGGEYGFDEKEIEKRIEVLKSMPNR